MLIWTFHPFSATVFYIIFLKKILKFEIILIKFQYKKLLRTHQSHDKPQDSKRNYMYLRIFHQYKNYFSEIYPFKKLPKNLDIILTFIVLHFFNFSKKFTK